MEDGRPGPDRLESGRLRIRLSARDGAVSGAFPGGAHHSSCLQRYGRLVGRRQTRVPSRLATGPRRATTTGTALTSAGAFEQTAVETMRVTLELHPQVADPGQIVARSRMLQGLIVQIP